MAHKDNTFNALKGEPLFNERGWYCAFGIHRWAKWVAVTSPTAVYFKQTRECVDCGKTQLHAK